MTKDKYTVLDYKLSKIAKYLNDKELYSYKNTDDLNVLMTYHSNALEGNTLNIYETKLIFDGSSVGDKSLREVYEASNHIQAFKNIWELRNKKQVVITEQDILNINSIILKGIRDDRGAYRNHEVKILGSDLKFATSDELKLEINNFNKWLAVEQKNMQIHPVKLASEAHYKLVKIHPFADGNGRTARLLMNSLLIKNSYPPLIIEIGERNKYLQALQETDKSGDIGNFNQFIYNKMINTLDQYIEKVKELELSNSKNKLNSLER